MVTDAQVLAGEAYEGGCPSDPDPTWPSATYICCVQLRNPPNSGKIVWVDGSYLYQGYYENLSAGGATYIAQHPGTPSYQSAYSIRFCRYDTPLPYFWYRWKSLNTGAPDGCAEIRYGGVALNTFLGATQYRQHEGGDGRVNGSHPIIHKRILYPGQAVLWGVTAFGAMLRVTYSGREEPYTPVLSQP